ncbi:hypothetical protein BN132_3893 [Cronobacter turicensis 564]|nr:hypothetical protein BN132_3893 [Cronobacter turicensis 564]
MHHALRHACIQQDLNPLGGDKRRLLRRFRQHAVACGKRGGHLAGKDSQREVPRADTDHRPERAMGFVIEIVADLACVITQEVDRFAHFGNGVGEGFTGFAHQNANQCLGLVFHQHGGALKDSGALLRRGGEPDRRVVYRALQRLRHFGFGGFTGVTDDIARLGGVDHRRQFAIIHGVFQHRQGAPFLQRAVQQRRGERRQAVFVRQIKPGGVNAPFAVKILRQRNFRVRQTDAAFLRRQLFDRADRIGHQIVKRQRIISDTVHKRGVGAVFQQATHQIGQQRFMGTDRRVDAARTVEFAVADFTDHLFVERLAHAVQALEFILSRVVVLARQAVDCRQRMGVVRGELRVNQVRHRQQFLGAGEVGDVGVNLAGVDRVALKTFHLGALDFAVPVGAFHQTDHQTTAAAGGEIYQIIDNERAALLVRLNHKPDAVPARQLRFEAEFFQQIEGDFQTVGLFGVDVNADVILARQQRQGFQARVELFHHAIVLGAAVARVQGGELNRNARPFINAASVRGFADGVNSLLVRDHIGLCVGGGERRFAQHIVGVTEAFLFKLTGVGQGLGDGFAGHELLAHQAHRHIHAFADQRLAALADDAVERARQAGFVVGRDQTAGKQQAPGGGVDEQRRAAANVRVPVAITDFVADQGIARGFIRNTQQRFGKAHQRHAFLRGE